MALCSTPGCGNAGHIGGVCTTCYCALRSLVMGGATTWEEAEACGLFVSEITPKHGSYQWKGRPRHLLNLIETFREARPG